MHKIAVLDYRIPQEIQKQIQALASKEISFPKEVTGDTYESNLARGQRALQHLKDFLASQPN